MDNRELFMRWWAWALKHGDCDPAVWMTRYLNNRMEHNSEQRLWLSWIYGTTYQLPTAWIIFQEFPDFELVDLDRLAMWNDRNYKKLHYQTDTKWNKGHLPEQFASYKGWVNKHGSTQAEALHSFSDLGFRSIWNEISKSWFKFGRYSTWFYLQHICETCDIDVQPDSLMLSDYSGSRSHRNGLLYALGRTDLVDKRVTLNQYDELETEATLILNQMRERFPVLPDVDYYTMETALCSFKKLFRETNSRYCGYYLDRQSEDIKKCEADGWSGINWKLLWQARDETIDSDLAGHGSVHKEWFGEYARDGIVRRMSRMFPDMAEPRMTALESLLID